MVRSRRGGSRSPPTRIQPPRRALMSRGYAASRLVVIRPCQTLDRALRACGLKLGNLGVAPIRNRCTSATIARLSTCAPLPALAALDRGTPRCKFGGCGVGEQETIIHNTGDEPILVEQADGSQMIVRPGENRQARLLSRGDFANPATPIRSLNPTRPR